MSDAVLEVRVDALEEWRRVHSVEDDDRHEKHELRIQDLELSRARMLGWAAGGSAIGAVVINLAIWIAGKLMGG